MACTGVHGANRLASNSLLEGLVYGARTGLTAIADTHRSVPNEVTTCTSSWSSHAQELHRIKETKSAVQRLMWEKVGILRDGKELKEALRHLLHLSSHFLTNTPDRAECELRNLMTVGELIIVSAMAREESRGAHYRSDYPCQNEQKFKKHSVVSKSNHVDFIDVAPSKSTAETQKVT